MSGMDRDDLQQETQRRLVESLTRDLDQAVSLLGDAERHSEWGGDEGYQRLARAARNTLEVFRTLEKSVTGAEAWVTINARAVELERLISNLPE